MTYISLLKASIPSFWQTRQRPLLCKIRNASYSQKLFSILKPVNRVKLNITYSQCAFIGARKMHMGLDRKGAESKEDGWKAKLAKGEFINV